MFETYRKTVRFAEAQGADRRSSDRQKLILRVGLLEQDEGPVFCLVRNISSVGVEVRPYSRVAEGSSISLRVGDESSIPGTVTWSRDGLVGIRFGQPLNPQALLRIGQKMTAHRRRFTPRATTDRRGRLRTGGLRYSASVFDITMVGARLRIGDPVSFSETTLLDVPGLPSLSVCVRWSDGAEHGVSFQTPLPPEILTDLLSR